MKSTGIIRKIDDLGRVVLPIELRRNMGIDERDPIEIYVEGDMIILKKFQPSCIFRPSNQPGLPFVLSHSICSCVQSFNSFLSHSRCGVCTGRFGAKAISLPNHSSAIFLSIHFGCPLRSLCFSGCAKASSTKR